MYTESEDSFDVDIFSNVLIVTVTTSHNFKVHETFGERTKNKEEKILGVKFKWFFFLKKSFFPEKCTKIRETVHLVWFQIVTFETNYQGCIIRDSYWLMRR